MQELSIPKTMCSRCSDNSGSLTTILFYGELNQVCAPCLVNIKKDLEAFPNPNIRLDDFIACEYARHVCGLVVEIGSIPVGRKKLRGYKICKAGGVMDFVPCGDAVLIAR